ncbi:MAG: phosphoribosyl-ATP diphosphatase [Gammaproteobacteria bacterium]|nr:phosphoribosyl-ATP diphosphatase [Gammaproteobacteria bacterium]
MRSSDSEILERLGSVLESRKRERPQGSYTAHLFAAGLDVILEKVGEEAVETVVAAKSGDPERLVYETADLWFHTLIMLVHQGLSATDVLRELARRFGTSGFEEKQRRGNERGES